MFEWINGVTGDLFFFCSRFCAGKYGVSWIRPGAIEDNRCTLCAPTPNSHYHVPKQRETRHQHKNKWEV